MARHGVMEFKGAIVYLMPTTFQTVLILGVEALLSVMVINYLYKKRGE